MTLVSKRRETKVRKAVEHATAGNLPRYDAAMERLDPEEREIALRELGRQLHHFAQQLGPLRDLAQSVEQLQEAGAYRALVLDVTNGDARGVRACVSLIGSPGLHVAGLLPGVDANDIELGDEVELTRCSPETFAVSRHVGRHTRHGAVARIERVYGTSLLEVSHGPDRMFLRTTAELERELQSMAEPSHVHGRLVSFDDALGLAFQFYGEAERNDFVLRELPDVARDDLVLAPELVRKIEEEILLPHSEPELAREFGVDPARFFIFEGSAGVGKTAVCRWLATELGRPVYLISGAELTSQWYGETESKLRARLEAAAQEPGGAVVIWDECESLLVERGTSQVGVEDRVVSLMLSFTDGFERRGDVLMVLTTNRASQIDHALRRALRAVTIPFTRPDPPRTRQLFERYLREVELADADPIDVAREAALAVHADTEPLAEIVLRSSERVPVTRAATVSGALVRASCERATRRAFTRAARARANGHAHDVPRGVLRDDVLLALDEQFESIAGTLAVDNVCHVATLPDDVARDARQVVSIERRGGSRRRQFVRDDVATA